MKPFQLLFLLPLVLMPLPVTGQASQKFNDSVSSGGGRSAAIVIGVVNYYVTSSVGEIAAPTASIPSLSLESGFITTLPSDPADDSDIPDGIADIWEIRYGISTFVPSNDLDSDGVPDLLEAAFNLNPRVPDAAQGCTQSIVTFSGQQYLQLVFRRNRWHAGVSLVPNRSAGLDPLDWSPSGISEVSVTEIDAETHQVTVRCNTPISSDERQFMRLRAIYSSPAP